MFPHLHLAAAMVARALIDYSGSDPVARLDAALWLLGDGRIYLDALGYPVTDPARVLVHLAGNKSRKQKIRLITFREGGKDNE